MEISRYDPELHEPARVADLHDLRREISDLHTRIDGLLEAIEIMRRSGIGCLPVVDDNQLVGIVTSSDFLTATSRLSKQHLSASAGAFR